MPYVFIIKINYLIIIGKLTQEHVEIYWLFSVFWNILSQFPIGDFNSLCIFLKKIDTYPFCMQRIEGIFLEVKLPLLQRKLLSANKNSVDWIKTTIVFVGKKRPHLFYYKKEVVKAIYVCLF